MDGWRTPARALREAPARQQEAVGAAQPALNHRGRVVVHLCVYYSPFPGLAICGGLRTREWGEAGSQMLCPPCQMAVPPRVAIGQSEVTSSGKAIGMASRALRDRPWGLLGARQFHGPHVIATERRCDMYVDGFQRQTLDGIPGLNQ